MTADDLLLWARTSGIVLEAQGDKLIVDAPSGTLTPQLRAELARHKPALLARLAPVSEFVYLRGGLTVPLPAFRLALAFEDRGFKMVLDECKQFAIEPTSKLTEEDRAGIRRWRQHLAVIIGYDADPHSRIQ